MSLQVRGAFRGFDILSRGRGGARIIGPDDNRLPELFVRGAGVYAAQLNAENPVGTVQSIEYALRAFDKNAAEEQERAARSEKMLTDYRAQMGRPFEHEARLKDLLARQAAVNAALDLDKGERQVAEPAGADNEQDGQGSGGEGGASGVTPRAARPGTFNAPREPPRWRDERAAALRVPPVGRDEPRLRPKW